MKSKSMGERLLAKLVKLGLPERKAKEVAKGLVPTVGRAKVTGTVTGKLVARMLVLGVSERKATTLAKGLAPLVRSAIKAKVAKQAKTLHDVDDALVDQTVVEVTDTAEDEELDKVAPRVNGHRLRLDLPVAPMVGMKGIELLRVMDGLTTTRTYLVAAVKSDLGIVAVRQLGTHLYNVKFYPDMAYWDFTPEILTGTPYFAHDHLKREWYQRVHVNPEGLETILKKLTAMAKPKSRMKALLDRFKTITAAPLVKAFDFLHGRVNRAA